MALVKTDGDFLRRFLFFLGIAVVALIAWFTVGNAYSDPVYIGYFWGNIYISLLSLFVLLSIASGYFLGKYLNTSKNFSKNSYLGSIGVFGCFSLAVSTAYLFGVGIGDALRGNYIYETLFKLSLVGFFTSLIMALISLIIYSSSKYKKFFK
ncbi:hypothetical protein [Rothia nasimurium]|uniref:hypothetical protein n=1 Tax=Rothia nasimurium TaxID=85336 RepID=UPI003BA39DBC